jgi:pyruvate/2-oxoglutarate dehydrogenase complex dihydrolipoamide acyltransferase (E2) component
MGTQLVVLVVERTKLSMLRRKVAERLVAAKKTATMLLSMK